MAKRARTASISLIMTFSLLFLSSCYPDYREQNYTDWRTGSDGITLGLSSIPSKIYSGEMLNLVVDVNNEGAYDNPSGKVVLSGFDRNYVHFISNEQQIPAISGKSAYDSIGGQDRVIFQETSGVDVPFGGIYKAKLIASACFNYETYATPNICVIPDPTDITAREICTPKPVALQDQGAPVAVKKVETETMSNYVNIVVTIKNVGGGEVLALTPEAYQNCPNNDYEDYDFVEFEIFAKNLVNPVCTPANRVKLIDGEGVFSCRFVTMDEGPTESQIGIQLKYNYMVKESSELTIQAQSSYDGNQLPDETPDPYSVTPSPSSTPTSSTSDINVDNRCKCTEEELQDFGGCICIIVDEKTYYCRDGTDRIPVKDGTEFDVAATGFKGCGYSYNLPYEDSAKWKTNPCSEETDGEADREEARWIKIFAFNSENPKKDKMYRECLFAFGW